MRTLGLLGGMSWESTREYYRILNEGVRDALGGLHSAPLILHSFDFAQIAACQHAGEWDKLAKMMAQAALGLEHAGAQAILICTNLMHKFAPAVSEAVRIPLLHIADAVGEAIDDDGLKCVALLGARFTMQEPFYREKLVQRGIEVLIPEGEDFDEVSRVIYEELCQGKILPESKRRYLEIIARLAERGAQGVVLGCTEIPLLVQSGDCDLPLYDTTALHANMALGFMLKTAQTTPIRVAS